MCVLNHVIRGQQATCIHEYESIDQVVQCTIVHQYSAGWLYVLKRHETIPEFGLVSN